jgi:hypothetical protein
MHFYTSGFRHKNLQPKLVIALAKTPPGRNCYALTKIVAPFFNKT